jgi:hypothetical protein
VIKTNKPSRLSVQRWPNGPGPEADPVILQWVVRGNDPAGALKVAQISTPQAGMGSCVRCPARWGGLKTAHGGACHETFTVVAAFDKHRVGSHTHDERHCLDPAAVGLVDAGRAYPCWGFPGRAEYEGDS